MKCVGSAFLPAAEASLPAFGSNGGEAELRVETKTKT